MEFLIPACFPFRDIGSGNTTAPLTAMTVSPGWCIFCFYHARGGRHHVVSMTSNLLVI